MSPARRLFAARRLASAATGKGNRTTFVGSPSGRPILLAVFAMNPPPTFCYRKSDRAAGFRQGWIWVAPGQR
jgi:hypothetical protein